MRIILFLVTVSCLTSAEESLKAHVAFKKHGMYAAGVKRGHLYLPLDLQAVRDAVGSLIPEINRLKALISTESNDLEKKHVKSGILMLTLQETLTELDATFKRYCTMTNMEPIIPTGFSRADINSLVDTMKSLETHSRQRKELTDIQKIRGKRQVEFLSLGLSLYNFYELNQLANEIDSQKKDIEVLKHTVEHTALVTNQLVDTVNGYKLVLTKFAEKLNQGMFELYRIEVYLQLNAHLQKMINEINLLVNGLGDLFQGRLNPVVLNWPHVENAMSSLHKKAEDQKMRPIFSEWGWILNAPFSFFIERNILKLYVHIPYYADNLYPVYEYLDLPIVAGKYKENGLALQVSPLEKYIAIDPKIHVGKTLTKTEFDNCKSYQLRDEKVFVCDDSAIVETHLDETCLGLLFTGIFVWNDLEKVCDLKLSFPKAHYHILGHNKLAYFLPQKTETRLDCKNISRIVVQEKVGLHIEQIPSNCRFTAPHISYVPENGLSVSTEPWVMFPREMPFAHLTFDWSEAEHFLNSMSGQHRLTKVSLDEFRHHTWSSQMHQFHLSTGLIVLIVTTGVSCIAAFYAWRWWSRRQQEKESASKKKDSEVEMKELKSVKSVRKSPEDVILRITT